MQIDILEYLDKRDILFKIKGKGKKSVITFFVDHLISTKKVDKKYRKEIIKSLLQREEMGSTAIGGGVALPHARLESVKKVVLCLGISPQGINFDSLDGEPVYIIALLLSHHKEAGLHLKILALLARILKDKYFVQRLKEVSQQEEVISLLRRQQSLVE
ncbi:MAG: hypothetical protein B6D56_00335 [Candidatus Omnitrophica bacterium 4484_70.1]|nr:MAG: hypothetical protein B6D56_00335 [Candidatus Omnitrophica bacterium 4484_70.1]